MSPSNRPNLLDAGLSGKSEALVVECMGERCADGHTVAIQSGEKIKPEYGACLLSDSRVLGIFTPVVSPDTLSQSI
jgi:hypothetical protein